MTDYYRVLGIAPQADEKEIKAAYRRLAKQYHPDTAREDPEAARRMYEVQEAYDVLGNEKKRREYDKRLLTRRGSAGANGPVPENEVPNPDMSPFERFFGFQPGKGADTYKDRRTTEKKAGEPVDTGALFEAFFGKKK